MRLLFVFHLFITSFLAAAQTKADSIKLIKESLKLYDLSFTDAEVDSMLDGLNENKDVYFKMHKLYPANDLAYPFAFIPAPGLKIPSKKEKIAWDIPNRTALPANRNDLAFYSIPQLSSFLLQQRDLSNHRVSREGDPGKCPVSVHRQPVWPVAWQYLL